MNARWDRPWEQHTVTLAADPDTPGEVAFESGAGGNTAIGSISPTTYTGPDGLVYTPLKLRANSGNLVLTLRSSAGRPPTAGDDSILTQYLIVDEHSLPISSAVAAGSLDFGNPEATEFTFNGQGGLLPAAAGTDSNGNRRAGRTGSRLAGSARRCARGRPFGRSRPKQQ